MDGRAGKVALNVRQMLSPPHVSERSDPSERSTAGVLNGSNATQASHVNSTRRDTNLAGADGVHVRSQQSYLETKDRLRERLVAAEARVAAVASSKARAQHMAVHLRELLSPQRPDNSIHVSPLQRSKLFQDK